MIRHLCLADLPEMESLRRSEQESVGFIPMPRYELEVQRGNILGLWEAGELLAFCLATRQAPIGTIHQLVTRKDARLMERASALVRAVEERSQGCVGLTCRCRENLEAVLFWPTVGFEEVRREPSGRRGSMIRYYRPLSPALFLPEHFLRGPGFLAGQRVGFRRKRLEALPVGALV